MSQILFQNNLIFPLTINKYENKFILMNSIPIYQRDPYLKIYKTKVLSCIHKKNPPIMKEEGGGGSVFKNRVKNCKYVLVLEETIFQPNGGGQPSDSGTINGFACE